VAQPVERPPDDREEVVTVNQTSRVRPAPPEHAEETVDRVGDVEEHERVVRDADGRERREAVVADVATERWLVLAKASQLVYLLAGIVEGVIAIRFLLKLIGANPANDFARLIYGVAGFFLAPFFGLTGTPAAGPVVLEIPDLIAILAYALLAWLIVRVIWLFGGGPPTRSATTYERRTW
jgi:YggT family protein